jgi:hypothetical protein
MPLYITSVLIARVCDLQGGAEAKQSKRLLVLVDASIEVLSAKLLLIVFKTCKCSLISSIRPETLLSTWRASLTKEYREAEI